MLPPPSKTIGECSSVMKTSGEEIQVKMGLSATDPMKNKQNFSLPLTVRVLSLRKVWYNSLLPKCISHIALGWNKEHHKDRREPLPTRDSAEIPVWDRMREHYWKS